MEPWTLNDSLALIRGMQQDCRKFGYHLCLGGGVLNRGISKKDLDLYFLPLDNGKKDPQETELVEWLTKLWGEPENIFKDYEDSLDADTPINNPTPQTVSIDVETNQGTPPTAWEELRRSSNSFWRSDNVNNYQFRTVRNPDGSLLYYVDNLYQWDDTTKQKPAKMYVSPYKRKLKFMRGEDRIDCFIL